MSGREPRREGLTIDLDPDINQSVIEHSVSPKAFVEGVVIELCHLENDVDREERNLILRYLNCGDDNRGRRS